jgi:hypothetical protein
MTPWHHARYALTIPLIVAAVLAMGLASAIGGVVLALRSTVVTMYEVWQLMLHCARAVRDGEIE